MRTPQVVLNSFKFSLFDLFPSPLNLGRISQPHFGRGLGFDSRLRDPTWTPQWFLVIIGNKDLIGWMLKYVGIKVLCRTRACRVVVTNLGFLGEGGLLLHLVIPFLLWVWSGEKPCNFTNSYKSSMEPLLSSL